MNRSSEKPYTGLEAAEKLGLNPKTVTKLIERGLIKAARTTDGPGGRWLITRKEIERFLSGEAKEVLNG